MPEGETLWKLQGVGMRGVSAATLRSSSLRSTRPRLEDVTLEITSGITAVVGPSGAGKTSLLNLLVEFERPDAGEISCATARPSQPKRLLRRSRPGLSGSTELAEVSRASGHVPLFWVPQDGGLWPHLTARAHLETVAPPGETEGTIMAALSAFDIEDKAASYPDELSLGEQARLSVARALAARAAVLVMDEPLVNVDLARQGRYWDAIQNHLSETGASLVYATHSPKTVLREAEKVICLNRGKLLYAGDVEELYRRPASPELMDCLGEGNWLTPDEARLWLAEESSAPRCFRPEQIRVARADDSPVVVRRSRFQGAVAEVELEHEESGALRRFFHRPASSSLGAGDRVLLKAILTLAVFLLTGCETAPDRGFPVREVRHWAIPPDGPRIPAPRALCVGKRGEVIVLDTAGRVLVYDETGDVARSWRMPKTEVGKPEGVLVLTDGRIAVADTHYSRVVFFDAEGKVLRALGREGRGPGEFIYPVSLAEDPEGNLYVAEYGSNDRVQKFAPDGRHLVSFGGFGTGPGEFQRPSGMVWRDGRIIIADAFNNRIQVFTDEGEFVGMLGQDCALRFPYDIAIGEGGVLYAVEYQTGRVSKIGPGGRLLGRFGASGTGVGEFRTPWGIAFDPRGRLLVADTGNRRIVTLDLPGR